jgi:hypothetical protein
MNLSASIAGIVMMLIVPRAPSSTEMLITASLLSASMTVTKS